MKIVWIGTFDYAQVLEVVNFLETQQTTDRNRYNEDVYFSGENGDYDFKIEVNRYREIKKIIVRIIKRGE